MLLCVGSMEADNLIVDNVTIPKGGSVEVNIRFTFDEPDVYAGFGLELVLPEGVSTLKDSKGNAVCVLDETSCSGLQVKSVGDVLGLYTMDKDNWILGTEGTMLTFYLQSDLLETGTELQARVKNAYLSPRPTIDEPIPQSVKIPDFTFLISIGAPADSRVTFDENSDNADVLKAATGVDVKVKRTIKAGQWSTICLPFAMTETQTKAAFGDDVQIADFTGCKATYDEATGEDIVALKLNFDNVTAMEANHPYIIKVGSDVAEFSVEGVDITPSDELSVDRDEDKYKRNGRWYYDYNSFIGTYEAGTEIPENALFLSGNKFWYSVGKTTTKAFRGYFLFYMVLSDVVTADTRISLWFDDDETTGISNVRGKKDNVRCEVYDLLGRRIENPTKGLYIRNGRKEVVK